MYVTYENSQWSNHIVLHKNKPKFKTPYDHEGKHNEKLHLKLFLLFFCLLDGLGQRGNRHPSASERQPMTKVKAKHTKRRFFSVFELLGNVRPSVSRSYTKRTVPKSWEDKNIQLARPKKNEFTNEFENN